MYRLQPDQPHVLFLFSDTGGGHRSAAEAIIEALELEYPDQISTEMVDIFKQYAPPPLDLAPAMYPPMAKVPDVWGLTYNLSNGRKRTHFINNVFWPYVRRASQRLVEEHPSDLIVSVHPLANGPVLRALGENRPPFLTVVTDLVTTHAFWYHHGSDLIMVPTEAARRRGILMGLPAERLEVVGLPVADRFCHPAEVVDRKVLRRRLGWPEDRPVVVLVGGGEGMGPLERTAHAIAAAQLPITLVIISGRNRKLKKRLEAYPWPMRTIVYGFVREMPEFMRAADMLVTKAGPGTISESFIANLPMILYSRMPGQEDGNVTYVVGEGAGVWAPQPDHVVETIRRWIVYPEERLRVAQACAQLARPDASRKIARIIARWVGVANQRGSDEANDFSLPPEPSSSGGYKNSASIS
jgi:1,2-diacylglycerol 3-beta-galactosyltransferase